MSNPVRTRSRGGGAAGNARRLGSADSKKSSALGDSKLATKTEEICLKQLKDALSYARLAIAPTEQKKIISYFSQLEFEVRSATMNTYQIVEMKLAQLLNFLFPMRDKPPVKHLITLLLKLRRCLDRGNNEFDPLKYVIRDQKEEPVEENRHEKDAGGFKAIPVMMRKVPANSRKNQSTSSTTELLKDLQSVLISRYEKFREESMPPGILTDKTSESDLLDNIWTLALIFADAAEEAAPKVATSNLKGKMNQPAQDEEMKHISTELDRLISELESPKAQTKWTKEPYGEMACRVRKARNFLAKEKTSNESKEQEMKQLNEEMKNLLNEINNPKPQTKWSREPEGGLPLSVRQARKVLSDEKRTTERKRTEMNQFCDEVDRLVKEIYYPKPQMQWSKEPDKEPALSVREARKAIAEEKKLTERRDKTEDHLRQEIQLLKEDIENLDNEHYTPQLTNSDSEHVKELEFLRKRLTARKEEILSPKKDRDDHGNMYVPGRLATTDTASGEFKTRFDNDMYVSGRQAPKS